MAAGIVNILVHCEDCRFADAYGRDCKHGLMLPVAVLMSGKNCPYMEKKTTEQIEEQLKLKNEYEQR